MDEFQFGMALPRASYHLFGEIDADTARRFKGSKQAPISAANFKNPQVGANLEGKNFCQAVAIPQTCTDPLIVFSSNGIPMGDAGTLVFEACIVEGRLCFHSISQF